MTWLLFFQRRIEWQQTLSKQFEAGNQVWQVMCVRLRCLVRIAYCYGFIKTLLFHFQLQVVHFLGVIFSLSQNKSTTW